MKNDLQLMIANAKQYNMEESQVYQDALQIQVIYYEKIGTKNLDDCVANNWVYLFRNSSIHGHQEIINEGLVGLHQQKLHRKRTS